MSSNWIYKQTESSLWTVGHYGPDGKFMPESDHSTPAEAADRIRILNGGAPTEPQVGPDWDLRIYKGSELTTVVPVDNLEISLTEDGLIRIKASHEENFGTWEVGKESRIILGPEVQNYDDPNLMHVTYIPKGFGLGEEE